MKRTFKEARDSLRLALPITAGSSCQVLLGVMDSIMIGQVGTVPLAASALVQSVFGFFYVVGIGLLTPVSVLGSRSHGAKESHACSEWLRHGLLIGLGYAALGLVLMGLIGLNLGRLGAPADVAHTARIFMLLITLSLVPTLIFQTLKQHAEAMGKAWLPMGVMVGGVLLNLLLNYFLIYGHWGAPALGLAGSGIATLSARLLMTVVLWLLLRRSLAREGLWPKAGDWRQRIERERLREMLRIGLPSAGQLLFEVAAFSSAAIMMGWLGTVPLASHQIALSCITTTYMIPLGISLASGMRIAHADGAGEMARLRRISLAGLGSAWVCMSLCALLFSTQGYRLASLYTPDETARQLAASLLFIAALFQLFDGTQVVAVSCLRGLGDVRIPTLITCLAYWGIAIPVSYVVGVRNSWPQGVWWGLATGLCLAAVLLTLRLLRRTRPSQVQAQG